MLTMSQYKMEHYYSCFTTEIWQFLFLKVEKSLFNFSISFILHK
jgi:hypothetical protein